MVHILTINIGAAAKVRAEALLGWLIKRPEDVFVLTETSGGPGTAHMLQCFRQLGYAVVHQPSQNGDRGVALVSRVALRLVDDSHFARVSIPSRLVAVELDTSPAVKLLGLYVPNRDRSAEKIAKKQGFLRSFVGTLQSLPPEARSQMILCGDYNVIGQNHRPQYPQFLGFERQFLAELLGLGFVDVHEHRQPGVPVYSWVGRMNDGYRYDYFHVGAGLMERVTAHTYLHDVREGPSRLTDHSAVMLGLNLEGARLAITRPEETLALF